MRLHGSGFTLIESLVALALVGVGLLIAVGIQMQQPLALERLRARQEVTRALEAALESVRAGALPLADGVVPAASLGGAPRDMVMRIRVEATATANLFEVTCEATYTLRGRPQRAALASLVWAPS